MDHLRAKIVKALQSAFPAMKESIIPYKGLLDETLEQEISYKAEAIMVCIIDCNEAPEDKDPWPLQANFGVIVVVNETSAAKRDERGWQLTMEVSKWIWRNCWGYAREMDVTPAKITGIRKSTRIDPSGVPTGLDYWTITFSNLVQTDVAIGLK